MPLSNLRRLCVLCLVIALALAPLWRPSGDVARAQDGDQSLLQYNTPAIVTLTPSQTVTRSFVAFQGDSFEVRLSPLTDFTATAVLLAPDQQTTPLSAGPDGNFSQTVSSAPRTGRYSVVLQASSGSGDMLVLINSAALPPLPLTVGSTEVVVDATNLRFGLQPPPDITGDMQLTLAVVPPLGSADLGSQARLPAFALVEMRGGASALDVGSGILPALSITLPAQVPFALSIQPSQPPVSLRITWMAALTTGEQPGPTAVPTITPSGPLPTLTPVSTSAPGTPVTPITTGPCQVSFTGPVNVRSGPSVAHTIIGAGNPGVVLNVTGRNSDSSWWQVAYSGQNGWVSNRIEQVITQGDCSGIQQANFPPPPTPTPTPTPTYTPTPTLTPTATYTLTPEATATATMGPVATLNYSLPPVYGSSAVTSGFVPDPYAVGVTGGGPASVSYLGGGCSGYTSSAPTFSLNYTAGAFPLLRFYFIGGADSTMIINTPGGSYVCVDDSFGTLNPTIDFNSPASGRYDIWIASFASGGSVSGTLYATENSGNHP